MHAVTAALDNPERQHHRLLATRNAAARLPALPGGLEAEDTDPKALDRMLPPGAVHQGLALLTDPLAGLTLDELIDSEARCVAVLDQLADPHNLGAIWRSAAAFGVDALILQTRHSPPVTGVVAKAAVGAVERVPEVRVVNIARTVEALNEAGWHTVGLAGESERDLVDAVAGTAKLVLVLGAEGEGLRPLVAKTCAELVRIPMQPGMESLNVSNAAAIAFYEAFRALAR